ncbi:alkaline phosphatase [Schaalia vaccimaxillae]|uniref:alkaline phosphatase n=1 Tax=Schaalia vaccimaxillae TaxID=183916 RepID=UPI00041B0A50|nr:alkaline phosphatase [Schaalia vaccimaxillae]
MQQDWTQFAMSYRSVSTMESGYEYDTDKAWDTTNSGSFMWTNNRPTESATEGTDMSSGSKTANGLLGCLPDKVTKLETAGEGALNVLTADSNGFFLMVEGGAVDWAGHSNFEGCLLEEQLDFNASVDAVNKWVETYSNWDETLVIVTVDHETGYLAGVDATPNWTPMAGEANKIPNVTWHSKGHTNALVPFFVKGAGADQFAAVADQSDKVRGAYLDNRRWVRC